MASSLLQAMVLGQIVGGGVKSILTKRNNKLVVVINNEELSIYFDMIKSWSYKKSVKLTENPVEQGVLVNDHRIIEPMRLTIEVGVSNVINPVTKLAQFNGKNILKASKILLLGGTSIADSPQAAVYTYLREAIDNSEIFDVETPLGTMRNFLITSIQNTNDKQSYGAFEGTLELQEILIAETLGQQTDLSGVNTRPRVNNQTYTPSGSTFVVGA